MYTNFHMLPGAIHTTSALNEKQSQSATLLSGWLCNFRFEHSKNIYTNKCAEKPLLP